MPSQGTTNCKPMNWGKMRILIRRFSTRMITIVLQQRPRLPLILVTTCLLLPANSVALRNWTTLNSRPPVAPCPAVLHLCGIRKARSTLFRWQLSAQIQAFGGSKALVADSSATSITIASSLGSSVVRLAPSVQCLHIHHASSTTGPASENGQPSCRVTG